VSALRPPKTSPTIPTAMAASWCRNPPTPRSPGGGHRLSYPARPLRLGPLPRGGLRPPIRVAGRQSLFLRDHLRPQRRRLRGGDCRAPGGMDPELLGPVRGLRVATSRVRTDPSNSGLGGRVATLPAGPQRAPARLRPADGGTVGVCLSGRDRDGPVQRSGRDYRRCECPGPGRHRLVRRQQQSGVRVGQ
jgi:hypothetical protein